MTSLWPPLSVIETSLAEAVAESEVSSVRPATISDTTTMQTFTAVMPAFMQDLIARRVMAQSAGFAATPCAGQIRVSAEIRAADGSLIKRLNKPYAVLLDTQVEGNIWTGWLVASETDYASYWDMLLDDRDQPFDPIAGMVQIWNPVRCQLPPESRTLAQFSSERLTAVRQLAQDFNLHETIEDDPRPGFVASRHASSGAVILTGTVLGGTSDPRRDYQTLYQQLSQQITQAVQSNNIAVLTPRKKSAWLKPALAIAATIMLVQGIVIQQLLSPHAPSEIESGDIMRGVPVQQDSVLLEVFFKPTAQEMEMRKLLTQVKGKIVSGPGEYGDYMITIPRDGSDNAIAILSKSGIVDSVSLHKGTN